MTYALKKKKKDSVLRGIEHSAGRTSERDKIGLSQRRVGDHTCPSEVLGAGSLRGLWEAANERSAFPFKASSVPLHSLQTPFKWAYISQGQRKRKTKSKAKKKKSNKKKKERLRTMRKTFFPYLTIMCMLNTHHYQQKNDAECLIRCSGKHDTSILSRRRTEPAKATGWD